MTTRVLVTGGAGYIGSCCSAVLRQHGMEVTVLDDLSTGHREAVLGDFVQADIRDSDTVRQTLKQGSFDAVMHFAAKSLVPESVHSPLKYFDNNVGGTTTLLQAMAEHGPRVLVFSSTCAVYGIPEALPLSEDHPHRPISPYGTSKSMVERILDQCREQEDFRITSLRYFNACGGMPDGTLGESHTPETHLIPLALEAAFGRRPPLQLYGEDYETRDGTCVRDYVHILDLAEAHRLALLHLLEGAKGRPYNVGTGQGTTVREVLRGIEAATGLPVPIVPAPRRPGDPPSLYAASHLIQEDLGWEPRWTDIADIARSAAAWAKAPRF